MGIIRQQTIKGSIYSYLGVFLGFLATAIITPSLLSPEEIGLTNTLVALSALYAQFSTLGFTSVIARMFPWFRDPARKHNGFSFLVIATGFIGFALAIAVFFILRPTLIRNNIDESPMLVEYIWLLIPVMFFRMFFLLLDTYNKVLYDAVAGTWLNDVVFRVANLLLLGAYFMKWIDFHMYVLGYSAAMCFPGLWLAVMLVARKQLSLKPNLSFITRSVRKEMISVSVFGIIGGLSGIAIMSIDKLMVQSFLGLSLTGIYSISFYFGTIILIPNRALAKISSTILADAWKDNDYKAINDIYYKSSINQSLSGCLLFVLLITNLHNIFSLLPSEYADGALIIVFISLSNLIAVSTGVSVSILSTSFMYKAHTYQLGILIILTVASNLVLIPAMGISGAALASLISMFSYSLLRVVFLKMKTGMFPYKAAHLRLLAVSVFSLSAGWIIPVMGHWLIDLPLRCAIITFIFIGGALILKVSDEATNIWRNFFKRDLK